MNLAPLLVGISGPIARTVLKALGLGVVSYVGIDAAFNQLLGLAKSHYAGIPAEVVQLLDYGGIGSALSIISGACVARLALIPLKTMRLL